MAKLLAELGAATHEIQGILSAAQDGREALRAADTQGSADFGQITRL